MLQRLSATFNDWAERWMPDPFVFAVALTLVTWALGILLTDSGPIAMIEHWHDGLWGFLTFGMQMCLILITGYALADAPPVRRLLGWLARLPRSEVQAIATVAVITLLAAYINWGLGLIVGALLARETAIQGRNHGLHLDYALLGATGYVGLLVWHGGLSGSAPLTVAGADHFLVDRIGVLSTRATIFSPMNFIVAAVILVVLPLVAVAMHPPAEEREPISDEQAEALVTLHDDTPQGQTPAQAIEGSPVLAIGMLLVMVVALATHFWAGKGLGLNTINLAFLALGLALHGNLQSYRQSFAAGTTGASGIILQFPLYAGIAGMMGGSGLVTVFASFVETVANGTTFPVFAFLSAGLVNFFVPSGGGQWGVQGPLLIEAAANLDVSPARTVMALAYGDQWTNMLQPFWALALLGITGLKARDIVGYTMIFFLVSAPIYCLGLLLLPM